MSFSTSLILFLFLFALFPLAMRPQEAVAKQDSTQAIVKKGIYRSHKTSIKGYPYAYYTPETALAIGVGGIATFYTSRELVLRPSKVVLSGYYSTRKQYKITLSPQLYLLKNKFFLSANMNFGDFVDKFWGIGNNSPEIETEDYDSRAWGILLNFQFPPLLSSMPQNKSGIIYDYYNYTVRDPRNNPFLQLPGVLGVRGGISSGLGLTMVWDSRNQIFYPTTGVYYQLKAIFYTREFGGSFDFNHYEVDLRHYWGLGGAKVLALQFFTDFAAGHPPFYELPMLGGSKIMRGYYQGRYRDRNYLAAQLEYRTHLWRRLGAVFFAALGDVSPRLRYFQIGHVKVSGGVGLRFLFNREETVNIRMDLGFGRGTKGVYFGMEEAF